MTTGCCRQQTGATPCGLVRYKKILRRSLAIISRYGDGLKVLFYISKYFMSFSLTCPQWRRVQCDDVRYMFTSAAVAWQPADAFVDNVYCLLLIVK
jgi:hypothetical protein